MQLYLNNLFSLVFATYGFFQPRIKLKQLLLSTKLRIINFKVHTFLFSCSDFFVNTWK